MSRRVEITGYVDLTGDGSFAILTGRDALVHALGLAEIEVLTASRERHRIDDALCREQNVPFAPNPSPELDAADRRLRDALEAKSAAWRAYNEGRGNDGEDGD